MAAAPLGTQRGRRRPVRAAVTLVELLLALAILVALASLAAPSMHRAWQRYRVKLAGDQLRAAFTHAHVEAMRTGQIQVMRLELGGDRYAMQPWMAGDELINASAKEAFDQARPEYKFEPVKFETLPEDVTFSDAVAKFDTRAIEVEQEALQQQSGAAATQWSQPILFYPDGTSSQAKVTVANERGEAVQVTLRKLTGLTTTSDVTTVEALTLLETP